MYNSTLEYTGMLDLLMSSSYYSPSKALVDRDKYTGRLLKQAEQSEQEHP